MTGPYGNGLTPGDRPASLSDIDTLESLAMSLVDEVQGCTRRQVEHYAMDNSASIALFQTSVQEGDAANVIDAALVIADGDEDNVLYSLHFNAANERISGLDIPALSFDRLFAARGAIDSLIASAPMGELEKEILGAARTQVDYVLEPERFGDTEKSELAERLPFIAQAVRLVVETAAPPAIRQKAASFPINRDGVEQVEIIQNEVQRGREGLGPIGYTACLEVVYDDPFLQQRYVYAREEDGNTILIVDDLEPEVEAGHSLEAELAAMLASSGQEALSPEEYDEMCLARRESGADVPKFAQVGLLIEKLLDAMVTYDGV